MRVGVVLALLLAAGAAAGAPLQSSIEHEGSVQLEGSFDGRLLVGGLAVSEAVPVVPDLVLSVDAGTLTTLVGTYVHAQGDDGGPVPDRSLDVPVASSATQPEPVAGEVRLAPGTGPTLVLVVPRTDGGDLPVDASIEGLVSLGPPNQAGGPVPRSFVYRPPGPESDRPWLAPWATATFDGEGRLVLEGSFTVLVYGPTVVTEAHAVQTGTQAVAEVPVGGVARAETTRHVSARINVTDGRLEIQRFDAWAAYVHGLSGTLDGTFLVLDLDAVLESGTTRLDQEFLAFEARGTMDVRMDVGNGTGTWTVDGEADRIALDGAPWLPEDDVARAVVATLSLVVLVGVLRRLLGAFSYGVLLHRADPLGHPRRRALLAAITASPGSTPAQLGRSAGCSRATVRFHLSVLLQGGLVRVRRGRYTHHYFAKGPTDGHAGGAGDDALWRHPIRRALARVLEAHPAGLDVGALRASWPTDEGVAPSAPLLSYHLGVLAQAGAVEQEDDRPRRWRIAAEGPGWTASPSGPGSRRKRGVARHVPS